MAFFGASRSVPALTLHLASMGKVSFETRFVGGGDPASVSVELRRRPRRVALGQEDAPDRVIRLRRTAVTAELASGMWDFRFVSTTHLDHEVPGFVVDPGGNHVVRASLTKAPPFFVRLIGPEGQPVSGVRIEAHRYRPLAFTGQDLLEAAGTNEAGEARFSRLGRDPVILELVDGLDPDLGLHVPDHGLAVREHRVESPIDARRVDLSLRRCGHLRGRVVNSTGIPARGAFLVVRSSISGQGCSFPTDSEGRFDALVTQTGSYEIVDLRVPMQPGETQHEAGRPARVLHPRILTTSEQATPVEYRRQ